MEAHSLAATDDFAKKLGRDFLSRCFYDIHLYHIIPTAASCSNEPVSHGNFAITGKLAFHLSVIDELQLLSY